ncbi:hypothetical protein SAMN05421890_4887 [Ensifer adhaerens]|nr:hypothetical protein SAMN05421890_4887 [Ensifer adhaerens]
MKTFSLQKSTYVPKELSDGVLYVSLEYKVAVHRCACGCGSKVTTPLGPTEWSFSEHNGRPTLSPSVGNWQLPCRSHYIIRNGNIHWENQWTDEQVLAGRQREQLRREAYYSQLNPQGGFWAAVRRFYRWFFKLDG